MSTSARPAWIVIWPFRGEMDIPLASLIQLVLLDDEEALQTRTLWSDAVLEAVARAPANGAWTSTP